MNLKALLLLAPTVVLLALIQSYLWVPSYEDQTTGNPERLAKFIEVGSGDAKFLNPILHADTASGHIVDRVFDTLLALDDNLQLAGGLATDWEVTESAYVTVNPNARLADGAAVIGPDLLARIRDHVAADAELREIVVSVELLPTEELMVEETVTTDDGTDIELRVHITKPSRLHLRLERVDPGVFTRLGPVLGEAYADGFSYRDHVQVEPAEHRHRLEDRLSALVPMFEHNPEIRFELRKGVFFHDGHELDSDDVAFTYRAILDPRNLSPRTSDFEPIKRIDTPDRYTVRVVYSRLFSPAVYPWSYMGILPEHLLNRDALTREAQRRGLSESAQASFGIRNSDFNRHPIGTGAFRFVKWLSDEMIHLSRNPLYWGGAPRYEDFFYRVIPEPLTQELEFRTSAADTYRVLPHQAARYRDDDRYQMLTTLRLGYAFIGYNARKPPFDDPRVRRALGMAIDVDDILEYVLYGEGERTTGPYPKNSEWYDSTTPALDYDPQRALTILGELGWRKNAEGWLEKDGKRFEFNLISNAGNPLRKAILSIAQDSWRKLGIKCNTQLFEWTVFLEDFVNPGHFDALVLGWRMGPDPDLHQIWHSSEIGPRRLNFVAYVNPEVDRIIERLRLEYDADVQRRLAHRLHRLIARDQPYTFLYAAKSNQVFDRKIAIVEPDGSLSPVRAGGAGDPLYHLTRFKKFALAPDY